MDSNFSITTKSWDAVVWLQCMLMDLGDRMWVVELADCTLTSYQFPYMVFLIVLPRCLILSTKGISTQKSRMLGSSLGILRKSINMVLHFSGSELVENFRLLLQSNFSHAKFLEERMHHYGRSQKLIIITITNPATSPPMFTPVEKFLTEEIICYYW